MFTFIAGIVLIVIILALVWLMSSWIFTRLGTFIYFLIKPFKENKGDKKE